MNYVNKNVDITFGAHDTCLELPSSGTPKVKRLESQIILKVLVASKPKGLNRIAKKMSFHSAKHIMVYFMYTSVHSAMSSMLCVVYMWEKYDCAILF